MTSTLTPLYDPQKGKMRVAGFMSGSGSNLRKIIGHSRQNQVNYEVVAIFSDNLGSNSNNLFNDYGITALTNDIRSFYQSKGLPRKDLSVREEFDKRSIDILNVFNIDVAAFAGYMSVASPLLTNSFLCINVHPADLSILNAQGDRRYTGDNAVRDAILAREKELRSTTHIVEPVVDCGKILMISQPVPVNIPESYDLTNKESIKQLANIHQNKLKEIGDWRIFPKTLEYIAAGRFQKDEIGNLYFDSKPIPLGLQSSY